MLKEYIEENDQERTANFYDGVGIALLNQGQVEEARVLYEQGLALARKIQSEVTVAESEFGLGKVAEASGNLVLATEFTSRARHRFDLMGITRPGRAEQFVRRSGT